MAVSRHLGCYRTANSAIRSANPENHCLEPDMEWIGCTVCEIFAFKLYCDLETGVRGHSRTSKTAPFDRAHTTLYSSSIVTMPRLYLLPFPRYSCILVENCYPLVFGAPVDDTFSRFDTIHACDGRTERRTELAWHICAIAYMLSRVKIGQLIQN